MIFWGKKLKGRNTNKKDRGQKFDIHFMITGTHFLNSWKNIDDFWSKIGYEKRAKVPDEFSSLHIDGVIEVRLLSKL